MIVPVEPRKEFKLSDKYEVASIYEYSKLRCTYAFDPETHLKEIEELLSFEFHQKQNLFRFKGKFVYQTFQIEMKIKPHVHKSHPNGLEGVTSAPKTPKELMKPDTVCNVYIHKKLDVDISYVLSEIQKPNGAVVTNNGHLLVKPPHPQSNNHIAGNQLPDFIVDNRTNYDFHEIIPFLNEIGNARFKNAHHVESSSLPERREESPLMFSQTLFYLLQNTDHELFPPVFTNVQDQEEPILGEKISLEHPLLDDCYDLLTKKFFSTEFSFVLVQDAPPAYDDVFGLDNVANETGQDDERPDVTTLPKYESSSEDSLDRFGEICTSPGDLVSEMGRTSLAEQTDEYDDFDYDFDPFP